MQSLIGLIEGGYALISKSPTKKVFPVEHFGADLRGQNCFPSALQGLKFSKGAAPRRRGAPRHPRAQKVRLAAKKAGSNPGSNLFFSPPLETDSAPEAHPNTYFPLRRRCAALVQYPRLGRLARIRDRLCADLENLYKKGFSRRTHW